METKDLGWRGQVTCACYDMAMAEWQLQPTDAMEFRASPLPRALQGAQRDSLGDPVQCPPCPSQGCLYEHHLHSGASLDPTGTQSCVTMTNRTGFLCHDRRHCIPAHGVCDGILTCPYGEDEDERLCREYTLSSMSPTAPLILHTVLRNILRPPPCPRAYGDMVP